MKRAAWAMVLMGLLVLVACAKVGAGSALTDSGIRGRVLLGPQCPVEKAGSPCPAEPFEADIRVVNQSGDLVTTAHAGQDGRFTVHVEPGSYVLKPQSPTSKPFPFGKDTPVSVRPHHFTEVTVTFDTGIR
jgi:hypothetical protein